MSVSIKSKWFVLYFTDSFYVLGRILFSLIRYHELFRSYRWLVVVVECVVVEVVLGLGIDVPWLGESWLVQDPMEPAAIHEIGIMHEIEADFSYKKPNLPVVAGLAVELVVVVEEQQFDGSKMNDKLIEKCAFFIQTTY